MQPSEGVCAIWVCRCILVLFCIVSLWGAPLAGPNLINATASGRGEVLSAAGNVMSARIRLMVLHSRQGYTKMLSLSQAAFLAIPTPERPISSP